MSVKLLTHTPNPLGIIYAACRQCYYDGFIGDIWEDICVGENNLSIEKQGELVRKVVASGHVSPIEHISFTFAIDGISRALSLQLVRHRIGVSFSQQSQRYVDGADFNYIIPPSIEKNYLAKERFLYLMQELQTGYEYIQNCLKNEDRTNEQANEDARFVLPNAAETRIVTTMNCRSLLNFFAHRCCNRAQWEIRSVANEMLRICKNILPEVFDEAGAHCAKTKTCPEGKFCCGKYPVA